ncbi:MAG: preprotein translocase subunit SecG [Methyloceanibacter sp.]|jgi:preprotein translocase subunit SecG|nr:MAG: preprotein translocase subunit SecG [Hyphomicrobiales bacterium]
MTTVLLVIHIMVAAALIGVVLLQRSEGGALGIGGGGGGGGFMTGRGAGNALTKTTAVLGAMFFATSLALTIIASRQSGPTSIFDQGTSGPVQGGGSLPGLVLPSGPAPSGAPASQAPQAPQVPQSQ